MAGAPHVSVVVATHQRRDRLGRLLDALEAQEDPGRGGFEVVVVDDGSTDGSWDELRRRQALGGLRLRVLRRDRAAGPATARNLGWRSCSGELVAFTDDDCYPEPGWLRALVAPLDRGDADLVQGVTRPERSAWDGSGPFARTMWVLDEDGFYATCNMAYRRSVLESTGGFDERFRRPFGEDTDLAWRAIEAGARTAFVDQALVHHEVWPSSWWAHVRDRTRREGIVLAAALHPELRSRFYRPHWYQASHPRAVAAAAGLGLGLVGLGLGLVGLIRPATVPRLLLAGPFLGAPYVRYRLTERRLPCRNRNLAPVIALAWAADLFEVGVLGRASVRYRALLL